MQTTRLTIVLDLDGTLIDTAQRHYALYRRLSETFHVDVLDFDDYWNLRRDGVSNVHVLQRAGLSDAESRLTDAVWRREIESPPLLQLDRVLPGVAEWLGDWKHIVHFALVTVRSHAEAAREQLSRLDLLRHFTGVIVVGHRADAVNIKAAAARHHLRHSPAAWVGDTELDIEAARELGARSIGVTSGIRTAERLRQAGADIIVESVTAIRAWPGLSLCAPSRDSAHRQ
jgi:phosphoglycolate phosphatase-like HAD superfamily hydrolase